MLHWKLKLVGLASVATVVAASGGGFFGIFKVLGTFW
jgi:hypothetical protein